MFDSRRSSRRAAGSAAKWCGAALIAAAIVPFAGSRTQADGPAATASDHKNDPLVVAREVDRLINRSLEEAGAKIAPRTSDEDFLRRVALDLTATLPSPRDTTLFALDTDPQKRAKKVD